MSEKVFSPLNKIQYLIVQKFIIFAKNYLPVLNCTNLIFLNFLENGTADGSKGRNSTKTVHSQWVRRGSFLTFFQHHTYISIWGVLGIYRLSYRGLTFFLPGPRVSRSPFFRKWLVVVRGRNRRCESHQTTAPACRRARRSARRLASVANSISPWHVT